MTCKIQTKLRIIILFPKGIGTEIRICILTIINSINGVMVGLKILSKGARTLTFLTSKYLVGTFTTYVSIDCFNLFSLSKRSQCKYEKESMILVNSHSINVCLQCFLSTYTYFIEVLLFLKFRLKHFIPHIPKRFNTEGHCDHIVTVGC